ncbi:SDR family NAD(P)-dependent oxidoreductase [Streptomyces sp. NPDC057496]|uniref:SDR family NAD(P)-dependent oxidoreductase n=1 Tax=Streptomyces sp. NPDC057496 TaxID=3346149 RepID=UPI0036B942E3
MNQPDALERFRLTGRTALITGAGRNIGAAIASGYAQAGADLLLVDRDKEAVEDVAESIRASTGRAVVTVHRDVGAADIVDRVAGAARANFDTVDILVNGALAFGATGTHCADVSPAQWQDALDINVLAPARLSSLFVNTLVKDGPGTIINLLSGAGFAPVPLAAPYSVSKASLWMLTRCFAKDCAPRIRVNGLCPGTISPDGVARTEELRKATPMGRGGRADEVVGAAIYLASEASGYSTGDVVYVNGGFTGLTGYSDEIIGSDPVGRPRTGRRTAG